MSWVKLDDQFLTNRKIMQAGLEPRALYVAGLCFCAGARTDGVIPTIVVSKLAALADVADAAAATARLVQLNLWERVEGGYAIHDYLEYNPSREKKEHISDVRAEAGALGGQQTASKTEANCQANDEQFAEQTESNGTSNEAAISRAHIRAPAPRSRTPSPSPTPPHGVSLLPPPPDTPRAPAREGGGGGEKTGHPLLDAGWTPERILETFLASQGDRRQPDDARKYYLALEDLDPADLLRAFQDRFPDREEDLRTALAAAKEPVRSQAVYLRPVILRILSGREPPKIATRNGTGGKRSARDINAEVAASLAARQQRQAQGGTP